MIRPGWFFPLAPLLLAASGRIAPRWVSLLFFGACFLALGGWGLLTEGRHHRPAWWRIGWLVPIQAVLLWVTILGLFMAAIGEI